MITFYFIIFLCLLWLTFWAGYGIQARKNIESDNDIAFQKGYAAGVKSVSKMSYEIDNSGFNDAVDGRR